MARAEKLVGGQSCTTVPKAVAHSCNYRSPLLLGVYDPVEDRYQAVCKCISGFTDTFYKELNERYPKDSDTCSRTPFVRAETGLTPQWYFKPSEVWEVSSLA